MSEEVKQPETTEVVEKVSEETIKEIDQEIEKVDEKKLQAVKEEVKASTAEDIEALKKELAEIKIRNEAAALRAQVDAERAKAQEPVKKVIVPQSPNPASTPAPVVEVPDLSIEQQWDEFERNFSKVSGVTLKK